jgi:HK97 family phage portal protein
MSLIKQLFPTLSKKGFSPINPEVDWRYVNSLVYGAEPARDLDEYNSAVFACLMTIASAYPEPPLCVYQKDDKDNKEKMLDSPIQALLDNPTPNNELTMEEMLFWMAWAKHIDGNAYWMKMRSGNAETGNVVQLWPISPAVMWPVTERTSNNWIDHYAYEREPGDIESIPVNNVVHFRLGLDGKDLRKGISPLKRLVRQISTDSEADKFVGTLLRNYAVPGLVVNPQNGEMIDEDTAEMMTAKLKRKFGNDNRGNIAVMSKETKIEQFGFSPKDLDMSILHRIPEERISAVLQVPAIVAGLGAGLDRATYSNFREAREMFTESKLIPQWRTDARKIDVSLRPDFTDDKTIFVDYDLTNVRALQEDQDAKYKRISMAVANQPWMTIDEARSDTGLPAMEVQETPAAPVKPVPDQEQAQANQQAQENQQATKGLENLIGELKEIKLAIQAAK